MQEWSRRAVLGGLAGLGAGLSLPAGRPARAAAGSDRKFLFVYVHRGWDPAYVFTPPRGAVVADVGAAPRSVGGLTYVDNASRPNVRRFFDTWADEACIINGLEVPSIVHERCQRLLLTGQGGAGRDDWPTLLAAAAGAEMGLPYLLLAGVAFTRSYGDRVVRVGDDGQLPRLLGPEIYGELGVPGGMGPPAPAAGAAVQAYLQRRLERLAEGGGDLAAFSAAQAEGLRRISTISGAGASIDLSLPSYGCERDLADDARLVMRAMELGLSRCAMLQSDGVCSEGWDTHTDNTRQGAHYNGLFGYLEEIMSARSGFRSPTGRPLAEELTIVVLSEMGRTPGLGHGGGKDHWPYTSVLLLGAGVAGGQTIGGLDEQGRGLAVDLGSGELDPDGALLGVESLGATLLTLGGIEPASVGVAGAPIGAALLEAG